MVAVAVAAMAIVPTAVTAQAQPLPQCGDFTVPRLESVVIDGEGAHIYPHLIQNDVSKLTSLAFFAVETALCLENGIATNVAFCLVGKATEIVSSLDPANGELRYVAYDGGIHIRHPLLLADLHACFAILDPD